MIFAAEGAADNDRFKDDAILGQVQQARHLIARAERRLRRRPGENSSLAVDFHRAGVGLDVTLVHHLGLERMLEDLVGLAEALFDVTLFRAQHALHIAQVGRPGLRRFVGSVVGMDQRRPGL